MDLLIVSLAAFIAALLTLFSGFGLGTLLMPVVAIFFSVELAIAITAIVHLANNLFKVVLLGRHAVFSVIVRFGLPAIVCAFLGAMVLTSLADLPPLITYRVGGESLIVSPIKATIGVLILLFIYVEISPHLSKMTIDPRYLPLGGILSGFFGGISGHQGAFRSMFLLKVGLSKEQFVGTGVVIACMVDVARLAVYGWDMAEQITLIDWTLVAAACIAAFIGSYFGARILKKLTIKAVRIGVSGMLVVIALGFISGLL